MSFKYEITVQPIVDSVDASAPAALTFPITNHDDLFKIVERVEALRVLPSSEVAEFAIGLKLLTEVLLRHRKNALFSDLWPQMSEFMRKLKLVSLPDNT